jgi:hypothetical protein
VFFLGGEMLVDVENEEPSETHHHLGNPFESKTPSPVHRPRLAQLMADKDGEKLSNSSLARVPSVAAQRFRRSVSEEPTETPMFGDFADEEPQVSQRAAQINQWELEPGGSSSQGSIPSHVGRRNANSGDGGVVKFVVGRFGEFSLILKKTMKMCARTIIDRQMSQMVMI